MGMANQLEHISIYACYSTRATRMPMEGGDSVPYGFHLPGQKKLDHNLTTFWLLGPKKGQFMVCLRLSLFSLLQLVFPIMRRYTNNNCKVCNLLFC